MFIWRLSADKVKETCGGDINADLESNGYVIQSSYGYCAKNPVDVSFVSICEIFKLMLCC